MKRVGVGRDINLTLHMVFATGLLLGLRRHDPPCASAHRREIRDRERSALYVTGGSLGLTLARYREYAADRGAALLTGRPEHLMSALQKIAGHVALIPRRDLRATAGISALFIISTQQTSSFRLWMDHPPLEDRLAHLAQIARELGTATA
jgi:hypothetical protein